MEQKYFENFGEILDEVLNHLGLRQIDLTKIYEIEKSSISTDRHSLLTRRKMMKYRDFMKSHGVSENFVLRGIYPILIKEVKERAKAQKTIDELRLQIERLEAIIEERGDHISTLKESLRVCNVNLRACLEKCGDPKKKRASN